MNGFTFVSGIELRRYVVGDKTIRVVKKVLEMGWKMDIMDEMGCFLVLRQNASNFCLLCGADCLVFEEELELK